MALLELHQKSSFLLDASMHRVQPHLVSYEYERLTHYSLHYGTDYRCLPQRILLRSFVDHCNPQPKKHELLGIYQLRDQLRIPLVFHSYLYNSTRNTVCNNINLVFRFKHTLNIIFRLRDILTRTEKFIFHHM